MLATRETAAAPTARKGSSPPHRRHRFFPRPPVVCARGTRRGNGTRRASTQRASERRRRRRMMATRELAEQARSFLRLAEQADAGSTQYAVAENGLAHALASVRVFKPSREVRLRLYASGLLDVCAAV